MSSLEFLLRLLFIRKRQSRKHVETTTRPDNQEEEEEEGRALKKFTN